jgi:hypothetical protein
VDNHEVALNGVKVASKILGIDSPKVLFYKDDDLTKNGVNSMFLKDKFIIAFNESWIDTVENWLEVMISCFHEARHAFQYELIEGVYKGSEIIDKQVINAWKKEFENYNTTIGIEELDKKYLFQDIEIDAILFSHKKIKQLFGVDTVIPSKVKEYILK